LFSQLNRMDEARETYEEALKVDEVKTQRLIWICYADFETNQEAFTRARTILQKARVRMINDEEVWIASIRLEIRTENINISKNLLSTAL
jgi:pre-mRNA-processing factor 6